MPRYALLDPVGTNLGLFDTEEAAWAWLDENITARGAHTVRPATAFEELSQEETVYWLSKYGPDGKKLTD
jgi:hypothetical protein